MRLKKHLFQGGVFSSLGILCTFVLALTLTFGCKDAKNMEIKQVVIYHQGKQKEIEPTSEIEATVKECLNNVVDLMKLIVTNDRIRHIREEFSGVEIIFSGEVEFKLKPLGRSVKFSRIFIPTSGKFSGVLFLGDENYGYSPYPPYGSINCKIKEIGGKFK